MNRKLEIGHYLKGNEPLGCFNTGMVPVIARSKQSKRYTGKEYLVGRDLDVLYNMTDVILRKMRGVEKKVKFFATKAAAFREFEKINDKMIASIEEDRKKVQVLRKKATAGDMAAGLALADY